MTATRVLRLQQTSLLQILLLLTLVPLVNAFVVGVIPTLSVGKQHASHLGLFAPPGSGYAGPDDDICLLPKTYIPTMEYPGTMRPGRVPSSYPYHDLPMDNIEEDNIPWPYLMEIDFHHRWQPEFPAPQVMDGSDGSFGQAVVTAESEAALRIHNRYYSRRERDRDELMRKEVRLIVDDEDDTEYVSSEPSSDNIKAVVGRVFGIGHKAPLGLDEDSEPSTEPGPEDDVLAELGLDDDDDSVV
eukprot:Nitzschia sp. Nitz4//scaffold253_size28098//20773//21501//NITZ4_008145-RA/size28098-processed-gene-0.58-mRNA-1//1//CDS//3329544312//2572//frame0